MLCTSSRFKSAGLFLTVSDSAVSEILFSFPSTVFPSFVFTERLVPDTTVLNCDQSFTLAGFKPWAVSVSDGNKIQAKRARLMASLALLACILLPSLTLTAQGLKPANVNDWSQLSTVVSGTSLSVKTKDGKTVEGKLNKISDTALSLTVKNKPADLKREDVQSICQLTKKSATKSTMIGLAVGGGAGLGVGLAGRSNDGFEKIENAATAGFAVLGAAGGALAGYLIGRSGRKRVLI